MSITEQIVGERAPIVCAVLDSGRLRFFAESIGETDPLYIDSEAAREAGHPDLLVPPTYLFGLRLDGNAYFRWLAGLGVPLARMLHGGQRFEYQAAIYAGDTVELHSWISDVYNRKAGALVFVVVATEAFRDGVLVARLEDTIVAPVEVTS